MEQQAAWAMYKQLHEDAPYHDGTFTSWAKTRTRAHPYHYSEGVKVAVSGTDLAPDDKFTTDARARPS